MKKILAYWTVTLILYGVLLALTQTYEILSMFYHFVLLFFPLVLILSKTETFDSLGFKRGKVKEAILWSSVIFIGSVGGIYFNAFLLHKTVSLVFNPSFSFITSITLGPVSEEIFHRGLLQTKFEKLLGKTKGLILASVLFALAHVPKLLFAKSYVLASTPLPFISTPIIILFQFFLAGIVFGYIYQETKSINYAIIAHIFLNLNLEIFVY